MKKILKLLYQKFFLYLRMPYFILRKNKIGRGVVIEKGVLMINSKIGNYCYVGMMDYLNNVEMGNYCSIAGGVGMGALEHPWQNYSTSTHLNPKTYFNTKKTTIGNDVWIGTQCYIRQGVKIGDGAVVGACSFVNKDVPENTIVFGSPAKFYKKRFPDDVWKIIKASNYWDHSPEEAKRILSNLNINYPTK